MRLVAALLSMALLAGSVFAQSGPTVPPVSPNVNRAISKAAEQARREAALRQLAQGVTEAVSPEPPAPNRHRRPKADQNRGQGRWLYLPDIGWVYRPHVQPQFPPVPPFPHLLPLPASERDPLWQQYLEWQRRRHHEHQHQQPWLPVPPLPGRPGSPFLPGLPPLPHFNPPSVPLGTVPVMPPAKD